MSTPPIEERYRTTMNELASGLDKYFNGVARGKDRETGFVLLVFPLGPHENGRCNYISNGADRQVIIALMKEMIARFEGQPDVVGRA